MLYLADFALQEQARRHFNARFLWAWYNGSCTMAPKPIKSLELHCTMIQFLIIGNLFCWINISGIYVLRIVNYKIISTKIEYHWPKNQALKFSYNPYTFVSIFCIRTNGSRIIPLRPLWIGWPIRCYIIVWHITGCPIVVCNRRIWDLKRSWW